MQDRQGNIVDRREMLRVKLKSLAEEARIIRREEQRLKGGVLRNELHTHRVVVVRASARATHLAYGLVRGRMVHTIEPSAKSEPQWNNVLRLVNKYGPRDRLQLLEQGVPRKWLEDPQPAMRVAA